MKTIITVIVIILFLLTSKIIEMIHKKIKKNKINFNEFDDINKVKEKEIKEEKEREYESKVLKKVFKDTYNESLAKSAEERREKGITMNWREDEMHNRHIAFKEAIAAEEKAKKDLEDFKFLDSVETEKENIAEGAVISTLKENGYDFDFELFKKRAKEIFINIKLGDSSQKESIKNSISEELYARLERQGKEFERDGLEFITEDLIIKECNLYEYSKDISEERIKVLIEAEMKEYILQKNTNEIVKGSNKKSNDRKVVMTFTKSEDKNIHNDSEFSEWILTIFESL